MIHRVEIMGVFARATYEQILSFLCTLMGSAAILGVSYTVDNKE
jgi:hypothetical protein